MTYKYTYIMEYLPKRYIATFQQEQNRKCVYEFKDGRCPDWLKSEFVEKIKMIQADFPYCSWRVCFIPASSHDRTVVRYQRLAQYIQNQTNCPCDVNTITTCIDGNPGHIMGKNSNPTANFTIKADNVYAQNIILIDDVITRGRTFSDTANKLSSAAENIVGLFLAKTINP